MDFKLKWEFQIGQHPVYACWLLLIDRRELLQFEDDKVVLLFSIDISLFVYIIMWSNQSGGLYNKQTLTRISRLDICWCCFVNQNNTSKHYLIQNQCNQFCFFSLPLSEYIYRSRKVIINIYFFAVSELTYISYIYFFIWKRFAYYINSCKCRNPHVSGSNVIIVRVAI